MKQDCVDNIVLSIDTNKIHCLRIEIQGAVQGVGFRPFVYKLAKKTGITGWVRNSSHGVDIEVEGDKNKLKRFITALTAEKPALSFITSKKLLNLEPKGYSEFTISRSKLDENKTALILPDIATCKDCWDEIFNPNDRRYRYPFTNCTNCGPRYSIIESLPYDRSKTSMKTFRMCEECLTEYNDPDNRRFHAQPNACPKCGPHLELWNPDGEILELNVDALIKVCEYICRGKIVAIKGLGGFHLIVDATNDEAVTRLRNLKGREEKPFALMYPDLKSVKKDCLISEHETKILCSSESPIILLKRTNKENPEHSQISPAVAPFNPYLGIMLPYTPLHHLLMSELGFPVVATSGNISEETICTDEHEALNRLRGIADYFLVHNRPIVTPIDDSVVFVINKQGTILRRARGYAPLPISLSRPVSPILAVGGHLKNSIAIASGNQVFLSQHIGDLETKQAYDTFYNTIKSLSKLYNFVPQSVASDSHPDYVSSKYAEGSGFPNIAVQHHHAHILSCMAENEIEPPVLGISWDGSGYGTDGTIWGGEFLKMENGSFSRIAHLRTFNLPGNEKAIKEPRRSAFGLLYEVYGEKLLSTGKGLCSDTISLNDKKNLIKMIEQNINSPLTSSMGRLFDAVASILGLCHTVSFEGQAAMRLEYAIRDIETDDSYGIDIRKVDNIFIINWERMVIGIIEDSRSSVDAGLISAKFHNTLADIILSVAQIMNEKLVVLSGGCFQNRYLTECAINKLHANGFKPYWHHKVPPNDGGLALGQIMAASNTKHRGI
ncbi:MAG: carbamoyltransferase HypF [candidate division Zixibacteria bacterium]|nr:carbamoyltransferase HypF [candidate division Zixibacteria bacterium]